MSNIQQEYVKMRASEHWRGLEEQARIWLKCGFNSSELRVISNPGEPKQDQVMPMCSNPS